MCDLQRVYELPATSPTSKEVQPQNTAIRGVEYIWYAGTITNAPVDSECGRLTKPPPLQGCLALCGCGAPQ